MTTSPESTVDMLVNDYLWMKRYVHPEQTEPFVKRFVDQGRVLLGQQDACVLLVDGDTLLHPPEIDKTRLARNCRLLWRTEGFDIQPSSSIPLPNLHFADDGEIKFVEHQQGIHIYSGFGNAGAFRFSTAPTVNNQEDNYWKALDSYIPPEQPEPFTTEPIVRIPSLLFDSLISEMPDLIWLTGHQRLLQRLETLGSRPESERWPSAEWPSDRALADARAFIHALPIYSILLPHLSFADDGEINFLWNQDGIHIDLGFYGTGTYSYFARGKDDEGFYEDDIPVSDGLADALIALLGG